MATLYKEILIDAPPEKVWDALRDFGALHEKLVRGFVTQCRMEGDVRVVTFFNGVTVRERLVGIDDRARRVAYTVVGGDASHHHASAQVFATDDKRTRLVWITDVLPNEALDMIGPLMDLGAAAMKKTLEAK